MPDSRQRGRAWKCLASAARRGTFYRRTTDDWANLLGVSRQRFHQIREKLKLPTRRAMFRKALTERLSWKARAQALWRIGVYDDRGDCWANSHAQSNAAESLNSSLLDLSGSKRTVLFKLRYGKAKHQGYFDRPTCGHRWCINPEHQVSVTLGVLCHRRVRPRWRPGP